MDDATFDRLVSEDVKNLLPKEKSDYLRLPENLNQWKESLLELIENLDEQITELSLDEKTATENLKNHPHMVTEYKITSDEKKTKISRFRFYVMQKISECEKLLALGDDADESLASFLTKAIGEHKKLMLDNGFEPTPVDQALWASIHGDWSFIDMERKLKPWVD